MITSPSNGYPLVKRDGTREREAGASTGARLPETARITHRRTTTTSFGAKAIAPSSH
ncbi:hypothetical protein LC605_23910 [Nostoc sp. CHAB 5836]|uniref:hypothetical protein n=1 Tax=Nostoc sp. CHAB 5836 TaxID=2780404 RepID=UPI001E4EB314|nr:hypothetical protein [Nostoc sp. CHAB 5836]MCC5618074.1 hypothetical protein [Nostoc sp. CHAB 5836]